MHGPAACPKGPSLWSLIPKSKGREWLRGAETERPPTASPGPEPPGSSPGAWGLDPCRAAVDPGPASTPSRWHCEAADLGL